MRIVVLGASGGCGRHLVEIGLEQGHEVIAVGRPSSQIDAKGAEVKRGDLADAGFLASCFEGADVVLSALGPKVKGLAPWNKPEVPGFPKKSASAIVEAARRAGVKRVLAVSAGGVGDSREQMPGFFRTMIKTTALKHAYAELEDMERVYLDSGLDVIIARPTGLTDGPRTGDVVQAQAFVGRATISRADVAGWMLEHIAGTPPSRRTPMITTTGAA